MVWVCFNDVVTQIALISILIGRSAMVQFIIKVSGTFQIVVNCSELKCSNSFVIGLR